MLSAKKRTVSELGGSRTPFQ